MTNAVATADFVLFITFSSETLYAGPTAGG